MEIGIFGSKNDDQVKVLKKSIEKKNAKATIIDFRNFPSNVHMFFNEHEIVYNKIKLHKMDAFYIRQLGYFWPVPRIKLTRKQWINFYGKFNDIIATDRENISFKHSMIRMLDKKKPVINPYDSFIFHRMKPYQFYLLNKHDLPIPSFITGSGKSIVDNFDIKNMVYKPLAGGSEVIMASEFIDKNKESLEKQAVLFQEFIKGENIRVFVLENEYIGAAKLIHGPQVDSRVEQLGLETVSIPDEIIKISLKAIDILGMKFSGIDFLIKPDGSYCLLECNPSPMFYVFQKVSNINVSEKLADYLINISK